MLVLVSVLGACGLGPSHARDSEVVGDWSSDGGGVFEFNQDGTFVAEDLKNEPFDDYQHPGPSRSGDGRWYVTGSERWRIFSSFRETRWVRREVRRSPVLPWASSDLKLYFEIGDPDDPDYYLLQDKRASLGLLLAGQRARG
jgi:hypothetical protein